MSLESIHVSTVAIQWRTISCTWGRCGRQAWAREYRSVTVRAHQPVLLELQPDGASRSQAAL